MTKKESKVMKSFQIKVITQLGQGSFESIDLKNPVFSRWFVGYLAQNKIPFQVVHLGEGVTRIIKSGSLCPHCEGKGFMESDKTPVKGLELPEDSDSGCCTDCSCKEGSECCKSKSNAA